MDILQYKNEKQKELELTLYALIKNWEDEIVEFKEANNDYDKDKIGKYFSAISNEANLHGLQYGWLVFGVRNKDRVVVGSNYRNSKKMLPKTSNMYTYKLLNARRKCME